MIFGYIVQLDLPGYPIKVGKTRTPYTRLSMFRTHTPVDARLVGVTIDGGRREADMIAAVKPTRIRGEWGYFNDGLRALVGEYHEAGEWWEVAPDVAAHLKQTNVAERMAAACPHEASRKITPNSGEWAWAMKVQSIAAETDPTLPMDWRGFKRPHQPNLSWPVQERA